MTWIHQIESTRISTGTAWLIHNFRAGAFMVITQLFMAVLFGSAPMPWEFNRIYAGTLGVTAVLSALLQTVIYFRGHYFRQPKIVRI
jgi:hypothetical protein